MLITMVTIHIRPLLRGFLLLLLSAISMLKDKPPGTFVVRDSNSFPGAFGLALKVSIGTLNLYAFSGN